MILGIKRKTVPSIIESLETLMPYGTYDAMLCDLRNTAIEALGHKRHEQSRRLYASGHKH